MHHLARDPIKTAIAVVFFSLFLSFWMVEPGSAQESEVQLVTGDWPPYVGRDLEGYGECAQLVTLVLAEMRLRPRYEFMTWPRARELAEDSQSDDGIRGTFPYIRTEERQKHFYFSRAIVKVPTVIFYNHRLNADLGKVTSLEELADRKPVLSEDYAYPTPIDAILNDAVVEPDESSAFKRLLVDEGVDFVPAALRVGKALLARDFPNRQSEIRVIPNLSVETEQYFMVPKLNPSSFGFKEEFDAALGRLIASGLVDLSHQGDAAGSDDTIVELVAPVGESIVAHEPEAPRRTLLLPVGTRAAVITWGTAYTEARVDPPDSTAGICRVLILTDPNRGRMVDVNGRYLRIVPGRSP